MCESVDKLLAEARDALRDETSVQGADFLIRCHVTKYLTEYMQSNKEPTVLLCSYASVRSDVDFATILYAVLCSGGYMRTTSDGYTFSENDTDTEGTRFESSQAQGLSRRP
jgi:hypothetical protein